VLQTIPSASETVNDVGYTITTSFTFSGRFKEAFCYVVGSKDHVNLGFPQGAALPDPNQRLKGTGKMHRHLRIETEADIDNPEFLRLVRVAADRAEIGGGPVALKPQVKVTGRAPKRPTKSRRVR